MTEPQHARTREEYVRLGMGRSIAIAVVIALVGLAASATAALEHGGPGPDHLVGTKSADVLKGLGGRDVLSGGKGADVLIGGKGADRLGGGPGRDSFNMRAGVERPAPGRDRVYARDGVADEINCGAGRDVAYVDDVEDGVYDCEKVKAG